MTTSVLPKDITPFNIDLLILKPSELTGVPRVEVLDIFEGGSKNFHPQGLFSTQSFGRMGEPKRARFFGYIELNTQVFHPLVFKTLCDLKALYKGIMAGTDYAVFDDSLGDFVKADPISGKTGFGFFMKHYEQMRLDTRNKTKRTSAVQFVAKYSSKDSLMKQLLVLPAAYRDYTVDESGKPSEDEVNNLYRSVLASANILAGSAQAVNPEFTDSMRYSIQSKIQEIYQYFMEMLDGKNKFVMASFAARMVYDSTRNVITAYTPRHIELASERMVSVNHSCCGLWQYLRATMPLSCHHVKNGWMSNVFIGPSAPANLINKKTLKKETVSGVQDEYDKWMTLAGFEKLLEHYSVEDFRHDPVEIAGRYAALIYQDNKVFKLFGDIEELPAEFDKNKVRPATYTEILYHSVYKYANNIPCTMTRYPVANYGSVFPCMVYLTTTDSTVSLTELDEGWQPSQTKAQEFPILGVSFFNTVTPSPVHLARAQADFDGDTMSFICILTDEAQEEIKEVLASREYYLTPAGGIAFSAEDSIAKLVCFHMFN